MKGSSYQPKNAGLRTSETSSRSETRIPIEEARCTSTIKGAGWLRKSQVAKPAMKMSRIPGAQLPRQPLEVLEETPTLLQLNKRYHSEIVIAWRIQPIVSLVLLKMMMPLLVSFFYVATGSRIIQPTSKVVQFHIEVKELKKKNNRERKERLFTSATQPGSTPTQQPPLSHSYRSFTTKVEKRKKTSILKAKI